MPRPPKFSFIMPCLAWLALSSAGPANAQAPVVRFASEQVFVSQRNGSVSIPVVIENSGNVENYLSVGWATNPGTARDHVHYGDNSPYAWQDYAGSIKTYPNQSTVRINIPIHYTATQQDHSFSVILTDALDVYVRGVAIGVPSACVVTIQSAVPFIQATKARIAKINKKIKKARKIKNPNVRSKKVKRLSTQKKKLQQLIVRGY